MATNNVGQNNRTVSSKKIRLPKDLYKSYINGQKCTADVYICQACGRASIEITERGSLKIEGLVDACRGIAAAYNRQYYISDGFMLSVMVNMSSSGGLNFNFYVDEGCTSHDDRDNLMTEMIKNYIQTIVSIIDSDGKINQSVRDRVKFQDVS